MVSGVIVTLTGAPGNGKTEAAGNLLLRLERCGLAATFLNDYPLMERWVRQNWDDLSLVNHDDSNGWWLTKEAYRRLSPFVARELGGEAKQSFRNGFDVVLVEGARGAYGMDQYWRDFYVPIFSGLGNEGRVGVVNVEIETDMARAVARAENRFREKLGCAPPPDIPLRYYDQDTGVVSASSYGELAFNRGAIGGGFKLVGNVRFRNDGDIGSLAMAMEGIVPHVLEARVFCESENGGQQIEMAGGDRQRRK